MTRAGRQYSDVYVGQRDITGLLPGRPKTVPKAHFTNFSEKNFIEF